MNYDNSRDMDGKAPDRKKWDELFEEVAKVNEW